MMGQWNWQDILYFLEIFRERKESLKSWLELRGKKINVRIGQNRTHLEMGKKTDGEK